MEQTFIEELLTRIPKDPTLTTCRVLLLDAGYPIGNCIYGIRQTQGEVYSIYVDSRYRKRGFGTILLEKVEKDLKRKGCQRVTLWLHGQGDMSLPEIHSFFTNLNYKQFSRCYLWLGWISGFTQLVPTLIWMFKDL